MILILVIAALASAAQLREEMHSQHLTRDLAQCSAVNFGGGGLFGLNPSLSYLNVTLQTRSVGLCFGGTGFAPQCSGSVNNVLNVRRGNAYLLRQQQAGEQSDVKTCFAVNGDETLYADFRNQYSKGFNNHDPVTGLVPTATYNAFVSALNAGTPAALNALANVSLARKFVSPQAGLMYQYSGADTSTHLQPPPPAFSSAAAAAELVELYWMYLLRDVSFADYPTNALVAQAVAEMNTLSGYTGLKPVTPQNLFRGDFTPAAAVGPYLSQFLYLPLSMGVNTIDQKMAPPTAGVDYATTFAQFVAMQNGVPPPPVSLQATKRYMINGRDFARWDQIDRAWQGPFQAQIILSSNATRFPFQSGIPSSLTQANFASYGPPHIDTLLAKAGLACLQSVWYSKWYVHRRARPEVYAARFDRFKAGVLPSYVFHPDLLNSATDPNRAASRVFAAIGNYLLPQAYPEGSPLHPSYGQGHACLGSAGATILKAFYNNSRSFDAPVQPSADGSTLEPYTGGDLTVGGELDKLISNIGQGRNIAGVHFRSDATASDDLGEDIAIDLLRDLKAASNEPVTFQVRRLNGVVVTI